jgi:hypothetical protein
MEVKLLHQQMGLLQQEILQLMHQRNEMEVKLLRHSQTYSKSRKLLQKSSLSLSNDFKMSYLKRKRVRQLFRKR